MFADRFTFHLSHAVGARQVYPVADDYRFVDEADGKVRIIRKLDSGLQFRGADYEWLKAIREGAEACEPVNLEIRYRGVTWWNGLLPLAGTWDDCKCTLTTDSNTGVDCVKRGWEEKFNILTLPKIPPVGFIAPGAYLSDPIECSETYNAQGEWSGQTWPNDCLPDEPGWSIVFTEHIESEYTDNEGNQVYDLVVYARYQRELFDGPVPPGGGWVEIAPNQWARSLVTAFGNQTVGGGYDPETGANEVIVRDYYLIYGYDEQIQSVDNGVRLDTILQHFADKCGLTVVSEIFGINATGVHPDNIAYQSKGSYANVVVFQMTDVTNAPADENATIGEMSFKELLEALEKTGQFEWDVVDDVLRIEHISYYEQDGPDWTLKPELQGFDELTADRVEIPHRVRFLTLDYNGDPKVIRHKDFDGLDTVYSSVCADGETEDIPVGRFGFNVLNMFRNPEAYELDGFVLVATDMFDDEYSFNREDSIIETGALLNGAFARSVLNNRFYRHYQYIDTAEMNGEQVVFETVRPSQTGPEVRLAMSAGEYQVFAAGERPQLPQGRAALEDVSYSALGCYLTFSYRI